jgi:hypothetical protein
MNRMADGVLKDMAEIQKKEDEMIARYEKEREQKEKEKEDAKAKKKAEIQTNINATLAKQQELKAKVTKEQKEDMDKQASMWAKERDLWKEEDARIQAKIKKINEDNVAYLNKQVELKKGKETTKMDPLQKQINKGLIREIKQKQRELKQ